MREEETRDAKDMKEQENTAAEADTIEVREAADESGDIAANAADEAEESAAEEPEESGGSAETESGSDSDTESEETQDTAEADAGAAAAGKGAKKGFFSKGRREDKEKAALQEKVADLEDMVKRQMAEFDNFRKRTDREKAQMFSMGEASVLEKMLPIVDNFERGFDTVSPEDEGDAFVDGMRKIYAQLTKQLEDLGVTPIDAVGKPFDPNLHNAVMQMESSELESGTVGQELLKGYMYHDTVLRHSMVAVVS